MQILIKTLSGKKRKFDIEPDETVRLFLCAARAPAVAVLDPTHTHTHTHSARPRRIYPHTSPLTPAPPFPPRRAQVLSIKEKLEEKEGITVSQQRLVFEGRSMENDKTIADFAGLTAGKCLHMVLSLRGGC